MKQRSRLFGNWVVIVLAFVGLLSFTACEQDSGQDDAMMYTISGASNGSQVSPTVTGTGTGSITGTYNQNTNFLSYTINYTGLKGPASDVSLYIGTPGSAGSLASGTGTNTRTANSFAGQVRLSRDQQEALLNGNLYYSVNTTVTGRGYPEIGGKITAVRR